MITAKDVAEYFLTLVNEEDGDFLTNLKIQKLLYYAQGFSLAILNYALFPEKILAWNLGPVVVEVYDAYKGCGNGAVKPDENFDLEILDADARGLLDEVFEVYGQFSPSALVAMTHSEPPWRYTKRNDEITHRALQDYFSKQVTAS